MASNSKLAGVISNVQHKTNKAGEGYEFYFSRTTMEILRLMQIKNSTGTKEICLNRVFRFW
ncbi:MAG: hypothetical protein IPG87_18125 [Saprospiraceae bacterium]|nr:hypothetical protein [Candidatus Vicinibacter affinis]